MNAEDIIQDEELTSEQRQASEAMARWQEAQIRIVELEADVKALRQVAGAVTVPQKSFREIKEQLPTGAAILGAGAAE